MKTKPLRQLLQRLASSGDANHFGEPNYKINPIYMLIIYRYFPTYVAALINLVNESVCGVIYSWRNDVTFTRCAQHYITPT